MGRAENGSVHSGPCARIMVTALAFLGCATLLSSCVETTTIVTNPPGAKVTINGHFIGITPVLFNVRRNEWPDTNRFVYRIERDGFILKEGEFVGNVAVGRIIGSFFSSAGLSLAWNGVMTLPDEVEIDLDPIAASAPAPSLSATTDRLQRVNDLYSRGLITEEERRRLRDDILNDEP
jgi:hypothetical protein